jgi:hypothetical protein
MLRLLFLIFLIFGFSDFCLSQGHQKEQESLPVDSTNSVFPKLEFDLNLLGEGQRNGSPSVYWKGCQRVPYLLNLLEKRKKTFLFGFKSR